MNIMNNYFNYFIRVKGHFMTLKRLQWYFIAQEESYFCLEEFYVICAQIGSYNNHNRPRRTGPNPTIHPWRPKIPCHQWTLVLSKKQNPHIKATLLGTGKKEREEAVPSPAWLQCQETPRETKVLLSAFNIKIPKVWVLPKNIPPRDSIWNFGELPNTR